MAKHREFTLSSGMKIFLGRDAENNDELVKEFKGKDNIILHTEKPGSPFCVFEDITPSEKEIKEAAIICAAKSQDWRDSKSDVFLHQFTGKDVKKTLFSKTGSWKLKNKPKLIKAKKKDIKQWWEKYN